MIETNGCGNSEKSPPLLRFSLLFTGGKQRKAFWGFDDAGTRLQQIMKEEGRDHS
jgi:hypothetical protein